MTARFIRLCSACVLLLTAAAWGRADDSPKRLLLIAGKPSHPPRQHEFNAGTLLLARCLQDFPGLHVQVSLNGWPRDEKVFEGVDAVVFYMDGGAKHEVVQEQRRRLELVDALVKHGAGVGCMHYGVEVVADQAGAEFKRWIGGHYETMFSCNPSWEPTFSRFPEHPITRGVRPFQIKDEWYFNMRFIGDIEGTSPQSLGGMTFVPILSAAPSDATRDGPYVYPKGPYPHIQAAKGRLETMMWAVEREDGGRGFGFTGGHFHDNWANEPFRKVVLNALVWLAKAEVPADGVASHITEDELHANLDPKK